MCMEGTPHKTSFILLRTPRTGATIAADYLRMSTNEEGYRNQTDYDAENVNPSDVTPPTPHHMETPRQGFYMQDDTCHILGLRSID